MFAPSGLSMEVPELRSLQAAEAVHRRAVPFQAGAFFGTHKI
jgi:hypothetical protein